MVSVIAITLVIWRTQILIGLHQVLFAHYRRLHGPSEKTYQTGQRLRILQQRLNAQRQEREMLYVQIKSLRSTHPSK